jgi:hypothetical protein
MFETCGMKDLHVAEVPIFVPSSQALALIRSSRQPTSSWLSWSEALVEG